MLAFRRTFILSMMQADSSKPSEQPAAFVKVALPIPVDTLFTYAVPETLAGQIIVGSRVEVPLGQRILSGIVLELLPTKDIPETRPIRSVAETFLSPPLIKLAGWMAAYYGCSRGEAAQALFPPRGSQSKQKPVVKGNVQLTARGRSTENGDDKLSQARRQQALLEAIRRAGGDIPVDRVTGEWGYSRRILSQLMDRGLVAVQTDKRSSPLDSLDGVVNCLDPLQDKSLTALTKAIDSGKFSPFLLYGVTGSGKTEVYLRAAKHTLETGGGCIVLVPEIGLLPQATARYRRVFGSDIAIIHSRLTSLERLRIWAGVERGEYRLVLGPRSAVFSPVRNLKLIIVDEEQDDSYKQDDKPRYHARNVALMRAKQNEFTVLMGSATPSAETYHQAAISHYNYLELPQRVGGTEMPDIRLVDMRDESCPGSIFSALLLDRLESNIKSRSQSIIFLNKRGHARFIQCSTCGWVAECKKCDISLTYHRIGRRLKCHFCGLDRAAPVRCEKCGGSKILFSGVGTQRVELELEGLFPGVGILRMDADTTSGKEGHRRILERFSTGQYPVLIGTQMVTKGHHFPGVNLVGVLHAEEGLNFPDFRSAEKTFQILTQVSGRSGRAGRRGEVIIQTYMPDHYVFGFLKSNDYIGFIKEELAIRKRLNYPPFSRLILASGISTNQPVLSEVMARWAAGIKPILDSRGASLLGPCPPLVPKVNNRFREQVLIKGRLSDPDKKNVLAVFNQVAGSTERGRSVDLRWDVDPESFF